MAKYGKIYIERSFCMSIFNKLTPNLIVDGRNIERQLEELKSLLPKVNEEGKRLLEKDLKKYRLDKSKLCQVKPYFIFTDEQLNKLIEILPKKKMIY